MGSKGKDTRTPSFECKIIRDYLVSVPKGASNPPKHVLTFEHACAILQDMAKCALQYLRGACCRLERCDEAHLDTNLVAVRMVGGLVECGVSPLTIGWLCESTKYNCGSIRCVCGACGRPTLCWGVSNTVSTSIQYQVLITGTCTWYSSTCTRV